LPYTDEEAAKLLQAARSNSGAQRWVPWLLAYTGARLEEVCQAFAKDIRRAHGIWVFDIHDHGEGMAVKSPFEKGDSPGGRFVIHVWDVDTSDARPLGRDREEDQAVSDRSDRRRMGADCAAVAGAAEAGPQAQGGPARG